MEPGAIHPSVAKAIISSVFAPKLGEGGIALKAGDVVQAKVIAFSQNNVILNIGGARIPASTNLNLSSGAVISLMVIEVGPGKLVLKQVDKPVSERGTVKRYTKDDLVEHLLRETGLKRSDLRGAIDLLKAMRGDVGDDFAKLEKLIASMLDEDDPAGSAGLKNLLNEMDGVTVKSGNKQEILDSIRAMVKAIGHESDLIEYLENGADIRNLKAALLEMRALLQNSTMPAMDAGASSMKASIEKMIDILNAVSTLNLPMDSQPRDFIYLLLPVKVGDEMRTAEIRIFGKERDKKAGSKESQVFTVAIALDMPSLGKTRSLVEVAGTYINLSIAFENREALREAQGLLPDFEHSLSDLGYTVSRLSVTEFKEDEVSPSLIEEKIGIRPEGIDFKA